MREGERRAIEGPTEEVKGRTIGVFAIEEDRDGESDSTRLEGLSEETGDTSVGGYGT